MLSAATYLSYPDLGSDVPVLYWVTDDNPARGRQIAVFEQWMIDHGHVNATGEPLCRLRVDAANYDPSKKIIQGISGVADDIWDIWGLRYYQSIGLLEDETPYAEKMGFDPSHTFPAIEPDITADGRQYAFPCNVTVDLLWVNVELFRKAGLPPPPKQWTFDEFERIGKALVDKLNEPGQHERIFFCMPLDLIPMMRSEGLSLFNETLTQCTLKDPRFVDVLHRYYKWTYQDRLLPSLADQQSFAVRQGYQGSALQLFNNGQVAMFPMGRYALIQLREFNADRKASGQPLLNLAVSGLPYANFQNTIIGTRCAGVYILGAHRDLSRYFLSYLASEAYNMQIVHDADALPPNPAYTQTEAFIHPPDHPEEWNVHEPFAQAARTIAISIPVSPYVLDSTVERIFGDARDGYMADQMTAEQAAQQAAARIDAEIQRNLFEQPELRPRYQVDLQRQKQIDALRAQGRPVPLALIANPFCRRYYQEKGWAQP